MADIEGVRARKPGQPDRGRIVELVSPGGKLLADDPRWQLTERVASSVTFEKANRLRELLLYLTGRILRDPGASLHEQEIGHAVFGRAADYDTSQDSLVRVQASKLRRRLEQYFSGEGADEPLILDLPAGSYAPVFRERMPQPVGVEPQPSRRYRLSLAALVVAVIALGGLCAWLLVERESLRRTGLPASSGPLVERFWKQAFADDASPLLVLSDANLTLYQDLLGHRLTLQQYRNWRGLDFAAEPLDSALAQRTAGWALSHFFVPFNEVHALRRIEEAGRAVGTNPEVRFARLVTSDELDSPGSIVLFGNGRVNPWVTAFDEYRRFRFEYARESNRNKAYIKNLSPMPGERPEYVVDWHETSYCVVAFLPNPNRTGNVVILEGAETGVTSAGAALLTEEAWMEQVWQRLSPADAKFPYFEILLEAHLLERRAHRFSMVAHRAQGQ